MLSASKPGGVSEAVRKRLADLWDRVGPGLLTSLEVRKGERTKTLDSRLKTRADREVDDIEAVLGELATRIREELDEPPQFELDLEDKRRWERDVAALACSTRGDPGRDRAGIGAGATPLSRTPRGGRPSVSVRGDLHRAAKHRRRGGLMSVARQHAEWLSLMDVSGPFLSVSVLREAFPNGLAAHDSALAAELRAAYDAWSDPEEAGYDDVEAVHRAFVDFVLQRVLGFRETDWERDPERLRRYAVQPAVHPVELVPTAALMEGDDARMLLMVTDRDVPVDQPVPGEAWTAAPRERMVELLRGTGCPLGLVTDGERWTVVSWRDGEAPGYATWWASLWREERITLQSFRTLLRESQFFSVPKKDTLVGLLERSAEDQSAITTRLGNQTLEAVEILIRRIDQLDRDRGGRLLADVQETDLYDAAVTVMMRLIFLFFAEENDLLPMEEPLWVEQYAASTLRARLQEAADQHGEEVLESGSDAWPRLLATWRAVYAGVEHGDMRLSPYGGSLFDPDRYPFLEGRLPGTSWREEPADPLPIDNRTVLHLLSALADVEGGWPEATPLVPRTRRRADRARVRGHARPHGRPGRGLGPGPFGYRRPRAGAVPRRAGSTRRRRSRRRS